MMLLCVCVCVCTCSALAQPHDNLLWHVFSSRWIQLYLRNGIEAHTINATMKREQQKNGRVKTSRKLWKKKTWENCHQEKGKRQRERENIVKCLCVESFIKMKRNITFYSSVFHNVTFYNIINFDIVSSDESTDSSNIEMQSNWQFAYFSSGFIVYEWIST